MEDNNKRHLTIVEKILYASKFKILSSARTLECRHKLALLLLVFFNLSYTMFSQITDTTKVVRNFGATITATNNGISLIPTFSLGKPTVMFDLSMGKKITFEPQFRFSAEGRPWSFFFWGRYKLVNTSRFFVRVGMHQALSYSTSITTLNGVTSQTVQRYFAGEITPNYFIAKCMSVGMYYLYSYGLDNPNVRNTNYVMMNLNFSNLTLVKGFTVSYMPAVYYLQINHNKGYNVTSSLTLAKRNFPVSMNAFVNKTIRSEIPGHKDFVWNISLIYAFSHAYAKQ